MRVARRRDSRIKSTLPLHRIRSHRLHPGADPHVVISRLDPRRDRAIDVALCESIDLRFARIAYVNGKADNERERRVDEQEVIELLDVPPR